MSRKKTARDSKGLTSLLFDELDDLVAGKSTPQNAKAKVAVVNGITQLKKLELNFARFISDARSGTRKNQKSLPALQM